MKLDFQTRVPGKWVLAGEHAVLRGATAVALPHPEFALELKYLAGQGSLFVQPHHAQRVIQEMLRSLRDEWRQQGKIFPVQSGLLEIESSIPIGAGLGSSAALCVAVTHWLARSLGLEPSQLFEFARKLENRFHGKSSGMDVAVTLAGAPITFAMGRSPEPLRVRNLPNFTFHDTGLRARTRDCIQKVEKFRETSPQSAEEADQNMRDACLAAAEGLVQFDAGSQAAGLDLLSQAMRLAQGCYQNWGLIPESAKRLEDQLLLEGALATKLTGAGGGGFVVALWPSQHYNTRYSYSKGGDICQES